MEKDYLELNEFIALEKIEDAGLKSLWEVYSEVKVKYFNCDGTDIKNEERTIHDIIQRVIKSKHKDISDKQINYMRILKDRINNRENMLEERKAERERAEPCPRGRINITGVVLSIKEKSSKFGTVWKMLIKTEQGYLVWGTLPTSIHIAEKGDEVSLTASVEPSDNDNKFGFFKRPTQAVLISSSINQ